MYNPYNTCTHVIVHIEREKDLPMTTIGPKALDLLEYSHIIIFQPCSTT